MRKEGERDEEKVMAVIQGWKEERRQIGQRRREEEEKSERKERERK